MKELERAGKERKTKREACNSRPRNRRGTQSMQLICIYLVPKDYLLIETDTQNILELILNVALTFERKKETSPIQLQFSFYTLLNETRKKASLTKGVSERVNDQL